MGYTTDSIGQSNLWYRPLVLKICMSWWDSFYDVLVELSWGTFILHRIQTNENTKNRRVPKQVTCPRLDCRMMLTINKMYTYRKKTGQIQQYHDYFRKQIYKMYNIINYQVNTLVFISPGWDRNQDLFQSKNVWSDLYQQATVYMWQWELWDYELQELMRRN